MAKKPRNPSQEELRQLQEVAEHCLARQVRQLNRTVTSTYENALRPLELKVSQLNVLVVVGLLEPVGPARISEVLFLEKSTVSRNVERLRARGWLTVTPEGEDGRAHLLTLTTAGRKLLKAAYPIWKEAQREVAQRLGRDAVLALNSLKARL